MMKAKRASPAYQKAWKMEKVHPLALNEIQAHCENNIKPIKNYMDLFINTSLNHVSIRSRLLSQPKHKLISNSE